MATAWMAGTFKAVWEWPRSGTFKAAIHTKWLSSLTRPMPAMAWGEGRRGQQAMFPNPHALEMQGRSNYLYASDVNQCWKKEKGIHIIGFFQCGYMYSVHKTSACCERTNPTWRPRHLNFSLRIDLARQRPTSVPKSSETPQGWLGICATPVGY